MRKEFILEMQSKGKLPRHLTEALERREEAYYGNTDRIFPAGPGGMDSVLANMLRDTAKRIEKVKRNTPGGGGQLTSSSSHVVPTKASPPEQPALQYTSSPITIKAVSQSMRSEESVERHKELKERLRGLEESLAAEKVAREAAEASLQAVKLQASLQASLRQ